MKRLLCLRLPHWPVQRLLAERPELRAGPLLLLQRDPRRGSVVADGCARARAAGVRAGMTAVDAAALLPDPPTFRPHDPPGDTTALGRLAVYCERFSPRVGWQTVARRSGVRSRSPLLPDPCLLTPDFLFLDITGVGPVFGGEEALTEQVADSCRGLGYASRAAVAGTLGAAWAVTANGEAITIVPPGGLLAALRPLPVGTLRLPAETTDLLARLGVETVADLLRLPRTGLAARFGETLLLRLDQALGTAPEILLPHRPPPVFEATLELDYPTERREEIDRILDDLIDRVTAELRARGRGAVRVRGEFRGAGGVNAIEVALYRPTDLAKPVRELVRLHCDRLRLPGPVDRVRLWADQTIPLRPRQEQFFSDPSSAAGDHVAQLIERLSSRLGPAVVLRPVFEPDPLPERAVRYVPVILASRERKRPEVFLKSKPPVAYAPGSPCHRPLRLLSPPAPIEMEPAAFRWLGRRYAIARRWGPERIETGWWRGVLVRRDYYRVETTVGRRFWLFRDLKCGGWFLHGSFE